ncbi:hypothetical protein [Hyunsoonleella ulvae]|uniref:hypothetical protein n=1 Tax=Hyunsoonleella ulvae TaxID=2799948 RepID=UPI001939AFA0|nr:hypothetical protein [Hyunsoonleella ulvae]
MIAMLRPVQPYVEYIINQDYIAEFLCINKDKPEIQCNGKCHLVKQIEKQKEQEPLSALSISLENYPIGFVTILKIEGLYDFDLNKKSANTPYQILYSFDYNYGTFQPPDLV